MTGNATQPAWNGYRLTVACACGVVFDRWVTPEQADADLLRLAVTGGCVFGYTNVRTMNNGHRGHVERQIVPAEAEAVR
jgi:hypothetical protein